jgi:drug/metabolite transporter (DMT)-like permease
MGQRLSTIQSLGVFLIISGVTIASLNWSDIKNHSFKLSLGVKETVLGAFFLAFFGISVKLYLKKSGGCRQRSM